MILKDVGGLQSNYMKVLTSSRGTIANVPAQKRWFFCFRNANIEELRKILKSLFC